MRRVLAAMTTALLLLAAGCGTAEDPGSTASSSSTPTATARATPTKTPTPTATPTPEVAEFTYECRISEGVYETFHHYTELWALGVPIEYCDTAQTVNAPLTDTEREALIAAYGEPKAPSLKYLYGICAQNVGIPYDELVSEPQAAEATGALLLCPDHPRASDVTAAADAMRGDEQAQAEGKLLYSGKYLVPSEAAVGLWRSEGERVEDCYWEVSDAQGNIIDNNFISVAAQAEFRVPAHAGGLTVEGCGFRWVGP